MAVATGGPTTSARRPAARAGARGDIQGLRALAVGLVVVYHLRPEWLPGGFVGVDVFFAISGFLIIGSLTDRLRRTGRVGLADFYARRVRRLVPAATAVLLATTAATILLLPVSRWPITLLEVVFSALNAQNWLLAVLSNDYGHATVGASPVQHFWSLAVEEQFYLVIPLVLLASGIVAARRGARPAAVAACAVALVTAASFAFSVLYTPVDQGAAYFITPTRMWELGVGGLAAMAPHRLRLHPAFGWLGLVAVLVSAATFTTDMVFPGWLAAVPVLGTVAVLVAGTRPTALSALLAVRPATCVGDISYSLYLWHWPVIVLVLDVTGRATLTKYQVLFAGALSLVLAALSTRFVENPFRRDRFGTRGTYGFGAALVAVSVVAATLPWHSATVELAELRGRVVLDTDHPGALALDPVTPRPVPTGVPPAPAVAVAEQDGPLGDLEGDCNVYDLNGPPTACTYGEPGVPKTAVIVGDSHAAQFSTALAEFARGAGAGTWQVKVIVRNGCPFTTVPPSEGAHPLTVCADENRAKLDLIRRLEPDLVLTAAMSPESYRRDLGWTWESERVLVDGYRAMLRELSDAGIPVAVVRELPRPAEPVAACLERHPDAPTACDTPRAAALPASVLTEAARDLPGVRVLDLTDWICGPEVCPAVVGNVVVYRNNHLTNTYVKSLSDPVANALGLR